MLPLPITQPSVKMAAKQQTHDHDTPVAVEDTSTSTSSMQGVWVEL
jgi:hypothetical protein